MASSQKNVPLILALALPIALILVVVALMNVPRFFAPDPQYNFVYQAPTQGYDYRSYRNFYAVDSGKLVRQTINTPYPQDYQSGTPPLYLHDVKKNKSTPLTFEEGQKLQLDPSPQAPDGYNLECGSRTAAFFVFFVNEGTDCSRQMLMGHGTSFELNTVKPLNDYQPLGQSFLGWVIPE